MVYLHFFFLKSYVSYMVHISDGNYSNSSIVNNSKIRIFDTTIQYVMKIIP